jgi:ribosomal protein L11 methyltransferase
MNDKQEIWHVFEIEVRTEAGEAIEFALNEMDAQGTEINNLGKKPTETITVIGYFEEKPDDEFARNHLNEALRIYAFSPDAIKNTSWRRLGKVDWLYEWKKHWKPTKIGNFIVAPTWFEVEAGAGETIIWIDPAMAFGTGTHQTTRLCLKSIEENYSPEMSFLDVGTGTGILAIAAAKFKIQNSKFKIIGCDTDEESVKIARENAELNKVADKIDFFSGSISEETEEFDFVCANLTADVIVPLLPLLTVKAKRVLVLSGILREQEDLIVAELKKFNIENAKIEIEGEWISIQVKTEK